MGSGGAAMTALVSMLTIGAVIILGVILAVSAQKKLDAKRRAFLTSEHLDEDGR